MLNPDEVLTAEGADEYRASLFNISNGIFFIRNHEDDLEINESDMEALFNAQEVVDRLRKDVRRST